MVCGVQLQTQLDVFHPGYGPGASLIAEILTQKNCKYRKVLDMGTGTGIHAILAARSGASVQAADISPQAIALAKENSQLHGVHESIVFHIGDLFAAIDPGCRFDYILFNPPYYEGEPATLQEAAWLAGTGFSLITTFLEKASTHLERDGSIFIVVNQELAQGMLAACFARNGYRGLARKRKKYLFETFVLYQLQQTVE